ncbi:MAG: RDD family protein [Steroidobacteraceae bacterium]
MQYPSLLRRYVASLIDGLILFFVFILYMRAPLRFARSQAPNYWPLVLLALYEPLLTRYLCTPGQFLMNIRVRTEPEIERVLVLRTFLRLFVKYILGIISFVFMPAHRQKRALHDLAADTIVIDAHSIAQLRSAYQERLRTTALVEPTHKHFPKWLVAGLVAPLPTILCCLMFIGFSALPATSIVLRTLVFAMLALSVLSCVMLPLAVNSIARKRSALSVRTVAQMLPAAIISLAFIGFIAFLYYRRVALR